MPSQLYSNPYVGTSSRNSAWKGDRLAPALGAVGQDTDIAMEEDQFLAGRLDEWEESRGMLRQKFPELDASAQAEINDLNKKTDSIFKAYQNGRLRRDEYLKAVNSIYNQAQEFKWRYHEKPHGSNAGDVIDDEGIQKVRTSDGGIEVLGYSPEYITKNTIPVGEDSLAVPISPQGGYKIIPKTSKWDRDPADERKGIEDTYKKITERYEKLRDLRMQGKAVRDAVGNVIGYAPLSPEEEAAISVEAGQLYVKQYLQAKHAHKLIADSGIEEPGRAAIKGTTSDPFVDDYQNLLQQRIQQAIQPGVGAGGPAGPQMLAGAPGRTIKVASHEDFAQYANAPDGTLLELPDGRLYQQEGGRFMQLAGNVPMARAENGMLVYAGIPAEEQMALQAGRIQETTPAVAAPTMPPMSEKERLAYINTAKQLAHDQLVGQQKTEAARRKAVLDQLKVFYNARAKDNLVLGEVTPDELADLYRQAEMVVAGNFEQAKAQGESSNDDNIDAMVQAAKRQEAAEQKAETQPVKTTSAAKSAKESAEGGPSGAALLRQQMADWGPKSLEEVANWRTNPQFVMTAQNAIPIDPRTSIESIPVGTAVRLPDGQIFFRLPDGTMAKAE